MPPELLRKGRFDEIFYVGLPKEEERRKIFEIHIKRRRPNDNISVDELAKKTEGFSGADIEGVVKDAVESAFANNKSCISESDIKEAISDTNSLYELMKESIDKMKEDYEKRKFKNASK